MQRTPQTPNRIPIPAPSAAQCGYGAATVVLATVAMLLLSQTASPVWIALIACAGLALGLLVAMAVPAPRVRPAPGTARETPAGPTPVAAPATGTHDGLRVPGPRARPSAASAGRHSLHG
ncbi:hypothetical protein [Streptomyces candidus]|uniref:Uncharacterized protein n=1 Tax=Streptomyces candidus TaxID=67283 RepID=A0A7X0HIQ2_9ACTN|nr:hypothetical protein [Streptomyces candidus]MBB6436898.1 hypothetical protein [Streptomyces candidus]GHH32166.1 hypothetical protein GCM10018773_00810 [Streptomyces candidus]